MRNLGATPGGNAKDVPTFDQIPDVSAALIGVADGSTHSQSVGTSITYVGSLAIPVAGRYRIHAFATFTNPANSINTFTTLNYSGSSSGVNLHVTKMNLSGSMAAEEFTSFSTIASGSATSGAFYRHDWWGFATLSGTGSVRIGLSRGSSTATLAGQWLIDLVKVS